MYTSRMYRYTSIASD